MTSPPSPARSAYLMLMWKPALASTDSSHLLRSSPRAYNTEQTSTRASLFIEDEATSLRGFLRRPLAPLIVNSVAPTQSLPPLSIARPSSTPEAPSSSNASLNTSIAGSSSSSSKHFSVASTATSTSSSSKAPSPFVTAEPSCSKYALVDVTVENISGVADDEHPEFDPFSLDAVPYGTEEADLDDPYDPNEPGLEELLGTEDANEIGTFRVEGAEFTENDGGSGHRIAWRPSSTAPLSCVPSHVQKFNAWTIYAKD